MGLRDYSLSHKDRLSDGGVNGNLPLVWGGDLEIFLIDVLRYCWWIFWNERLHTFNCQPMSSPADTF